VIKSNYDLFFYKKTKNKYMNFIIKEVESIPLEYFTARQVAEFMNVTKNTVNRWNREGYKVDNDTFVKLTRTGQRIYKKDLIPFMYLYYETKRIKRQVGLVH
jgi:Mn-dependent DtxR family transcriptional regulator